MLSLHRVRAFGPLNTLVLAGVCLALSACGGAEPTGRAVGDEAVDDGVEEDGAAEDDADGDDADEDRAPDADARGDGTDASSPDGPDEGPHIVATTSILGDVVSSLVGDDGRVDILIPAGADPHAYQTSATDAAMLREADLVVANGLQLEESVLSALDAAEQEGVRVFTVADKLDPIGFGDHADDVHADDVHADDVHAEDEHAEDEQADDHGHGSEDPHVWFDPVRMADGARLLAEEIAAVDRSLDADEWLRRGEAYAGDLLELDAEIERILAAVPDDDRRLVTNHDALGYLAARYGFELLGTVIPGSSTQAEADARGFAALIETVEQADVPAIFAENTDSTTLSEQLASEVIGRGDLEVEVVRIYTDALGEPGSGAETYPDMLRATAILIADALT